MAITVVNPARLLTLQGINALFGPWSVALYTNDATVDEFTDAGDLEAPTFPGYAAQEFPGNPSWQVNPITGRAELTLGTVTFQRSAGGSPQTVRGYAVYSANHGLVFLEEFAAPQTLQLEGDGFHLPIKLSVWSVPTS